MSTRAIICTTDGPEKGCTTWDHDQHVDARHALDQDPNGWGSEYGAAAMDEIERLRALTTITDHMVEKAAEALVYTMGQESDGACWISEWEGRTVIDGTFDMPSAVRAALEAALNPPT